MSKDVFKKRIVPVSVVLFMPLLYFSSGISLYIVCVSTPDLSEIFYPFFYSIMFFWSRNMINIQLYHITKQKYRVFNRGTMSFIAFCVIYFVFHKSLPISDFSYFLIMCIVEGIVFFEFVIRVLNEGANILGIKIFSIKKI
jgi:hypothetical protein